MYMYGHTCFISLWNLRKTVRKYFGDLVYMCLVLVRVKFLCMSLRSVGALRYSCTP
jgi:hypothetical protein